MVPLSADLQITRTTVDADANQQVTRETNRFYRDSRGRTRTEAGPTVTINDPTTRTTVVLDTEAGTFHRSTRDRSSLTPSAAPERTLSPSQQLASPPRSLGGATVGGVRAEGTAYTITVPAAAGLPRQVHEVTLWQPAEVQLGVETRVVRASGAVYHQKYRNIQAGSEPPAALFRVPAGYQEVDPTSDRSINAPCPVGYFDPFIITSFGAFLGSGFDFAVTDPELGCLFIADQGIFPQIQLFGGRPRRWGCRSTSGSSSIPVPPCHSCRSRRSATSSQTQASCIDWPRIRSVVGRLRGGTVLPAGTVSRSGGCGIVGTCSTSSSQSWRRRSRRCSGRSSSC